MSPLQTQLVEIVRSAGSSGIHRRTLVRMTGRHPETVRLALQSLRAVGLTQVGRGPASRWVGAEHAQSLASVIAADVERNRRAGWKKVEPATERAPVRRTPPKTTAPRSVFELGVAR